MHQQVEELKAGTRMARRIPEGRIMHALLNRVGDWSEHEQ